MKYRSYTDVPDQADLADYAENISRGKCRRFANTRRLCRDTTRLQLQLRTLLHGDLSNRASCDHLIQAAKFKQVSKT